jgi:hypothetical protein
MILNVTAFLALLLLGLLTIILYAIYQVSGLSSK